MDLSLERENRLNFPIHRAEPMDENESNESRLAETTPLELQHAEISGATKCQSEDAKILCIYDLFHKLSSNNVYDIGGTYSGESPDLWFYCSTSSAPGEIFLLNLFVCHRTDGEFTIGISHGTHMTLTKKSQWSKQIFMPEELNFKAYRSAKPNESHYITTFKFSGQDVKALENQTLCIPLKIDLECVMVVKNEVVRDIKLKHDLSELLKMQEKTDFILESVSKKQYPSHQIVLAAHSPVFREIMKNSSSKTAFIDILDSDMELLLEFIYTGTLKDIHKLDCLKLLQIADRFQLKNLFLLTQYAIKDHIDVKSAIDVAVLSEKYSLELLQKCVFDFIKSNPDILETEGWKNLNDVKLTKKLFSYMQSQKPKD